jgi:Ca2+-binding EF-hand superfamily protein
MQSAFAMLSTVGFCLALLLGSVPGRAQDPAAKPKRFSSAWVDERFHKLDRNGDGFLGYEEMTDDLKVVKNKWDANSDGRIDLAEWREYAKAYIAHQQQLHQQQRPQPRRGGPGKPPGPLGPIDPGGIHPPPREEGPKKKKPVVHKLPNNCPAWFKYYDIDGDGQVALREWKEKNENLPEFKKWDTNGDGFITISELVRSGYFATDTGKTPQSPHGLKAEPGEFFYFEVTGARAPGVWGTDVYPIYCPMATAAVHAGVLKVGETRYIKVTVLQGEQSYEGTERHGVTSHPFGPCPLSYRIEAIP